MIALGGLFVLVTVMAIVLLAQREFYGLIEDKGARPFVGLRAWRPAPRCPWSRTSATSTTRCC